jgi:CRP-like cAMP-binding protein
VRYFYCLLDGEAEVVQRADNGVEHVLNTLHAGETFGENSLLEGNARRSVSVRCSTPVEVLKLSKEDFEAGFAPTGGGGGGGASHGQLARRSSGAEMELRSRLISFIRMVSCQEHRTLTRGEAVFREGEAADTFYILSSGQLTVWPGEGVSRAATAASAVQEAVQGAAAAPQAQQESAATKPALPLGMIEPGEGFGESALLRRPAKHACVPHTKTVTCTAENCEVVQILGDDFLRLVEKSRVVRDSFERLRMRRNTQNEKSRPAMQQKG